jgi:lysophospholipase L1-like esterase
MTSSALSALRTLGAPRPCRGTSRSSGKGTGTSPRLQIENLEDRCLLSSFPATIPSPVNGLGDFIGSELQAAAQAPVGNPPVIFLGDSITWGYAFGPGAQMWSALWAPFHADDFGIPGSSTPTLLWQIDNGQLSGANPHVVVLMIGTNNLLIDGDTPVQTAQGVLASVLAIHEAVPGATVLVVGIPPAGASPNDPYREQVRQTNTLINEEMAALPQTLYVDIGSVFVQPDGWISPLIMSDYLHPTTAGYFLETLALMPSLLEAYLMSNPNSSPPPAPPPTFVAS